MRNAIRQDANFRNGQYYGQVVPEGGLAIARMLAHITYLSSESMQRKFDPTRFEPRDVATAFEKKFSVGSYLAYQGDRFVERFDANCYVTLSTAMDLFDLGDSVEKLRQAVRSSTCGQVITCWGRRPPARTLSVRADDLKPRDHLEMDDADAHAGPSPRLSVAFWEGENPSPSGDAFRGFAVRWSP
jgi:homoserine O-acetyltransferase